MKTKRFHNLIFAGAMFICSGSLYAAKNPYERFKHLFHIDKLESSQDKTPVDTAKSMLYFYNPKEEHTFGNTKVVYCRNTSTTICASIKAGISSPTTPAVFEVNVYEENGRKTRYVPRQLSVDQIEDRVVAIQMEF